MNEMLSSIRALLDEIENAVDDTQTELQAACDEAADWEEEVNKLSLELEELKAAFNEYEDAGETKSDVNET